MEVDLGLFSMQFATASTAPETTYQVDYSLPLVALSFMFAVAGAYVGLLASAQAKNSENSIWHNVWIIASATALAAGIWSMHFVGMIAYQLPMAVHYNANLTLLSIIPAPIACFFVLKVLVRPVVTKRQLAFGSLLLGLGIGTMHYIGMGAMHAEAAMVYDPWLAGLSIIVAVFFAYIALSTKVHLGKQSRFVDLIWVDPLSAAVLGVAVSGMHYIAMLAVQFYPGESHAHHFPESDMDFQLILIDVSVALIGALLFIAALARKNRANTQLLSAQNSLAEVERRWDIALKGAGLGVWDLNFVTHEFYFSPTWRRIRGFGPDEEIEGGSEGWLQRIHSDDRDALLKSVRKMDAGEIERGFVEYRERHRDGHYIWMQGRGEPITFDADGNPTRVIGIDIDITKKKELEIEVSHNLHLLNTTLDNFPGGICMHDENLTLVFANKGYYDVNLIEEKDFPAGTPIEDIFKYYAKRDGLSGREAEEYVAERVADARTCSAAKYQRIRPHDGACLEFTRTPLKEGGFVLKIEDITEKLEEQRKREQLEHDLGLAQKMESLGTLASGVAHEINTPVQYVGDNIRFLHESFSDLTALLEEYKKNFKNETSKASQAIAEKEDEIDLEFLLEELPRSLTQSLQGIAQISKIVNAIKEYSHPGQEEMDAVDLNATIESTLTVSHNQWKYVAEVETDFSPDLPLVSCFQGEISQVILNMVVNAAHAIETSDRADNGLIKLSTRRDGGCAIIEITDNGAGMSEDIRKRVFDPFFTTKDIGIGTGQGLAISFAIIHNKHHGSIQCSSEVGVGTCFTIRLPIEAAQETDDTDERAA